MLFDSFRLNLEFSLKVSSNVRDYYYVRFWFKVPCVSHIVGSSQLYMCTIRVYNTSNFYIVIYNFQVKILRIRPSLKLEIWLGL